MKTKRNHKLIILTAKIAIITRSTRTTVPVTIKTMTQVSSLSDSVEREVRID